VSVSGAYAIGLATVLFVGFGLFSLASRARTGGSSVTQQARRWRFLAGLGCLVLAAIVGLVGWLRLSLEPAVNRQIPYLASAGMTLVLLSALGGSLLVAEQLRTGEERLQELEAAVMELAERIAPAIEAPGRRRGAQTAPAAKGERAAPAGGRRLQ